MKNENEILAEVEKTLQAFDNDPVLEENPFLFTRIQAAKTSLLQKRDQRFALKIRFKLIVIVAVALLNLFTAVYYFKGNTKKDLKEQLVSDLKEDMLIDQF